MHWPTPLWTANVLFYIDYSSLSTRMRRRADPRFLKKVFRKVFDAEEDGFCYCPTGWIPEEASSAQPFRA